ncbi:MAG: DUF1847 domain-containing protein [Lachnospiraceae bacterium]|nr:DUF1847 domain-containing protein [Lachnospiraceae bacterium]
MENKTCQYSCVDCGSQGCHGDGAFPSFCHTLKMTEEEKEKLYALYEEEENRRLEDGANIAKVEAGHDTRLECTMSFARQLGAKKIGIATCISTLKEAKVAAMVLRRHGFEVYSAMCKIGAMARELDKARNVTMCNPIEQAFYLNEQDTDLNILIGLCVGHDSLFYRYSKAPVTTLVAKDWALEHNPIRALQDESIYSKL